MKFTNIKDKTLGSRLGYKINFDVVRKEITLDEKSVVVYYLSSLVDNQIVVYLLENISKREKLSNGSIEEISDINLVESQVNSGMLAILNYTDNTYLIVDVRNYPSRSASEPESEKSIKGSHDGFTEHMLINTALIRRRIKTRDFRCELLTIGEMSKTYVNVYYIENRVNKRLYKEVIQRLHRLNIDSLVMADRSLAELLFKQSFNVFPVVRFTERPDIASIHILKGYLVIMVDNSPSAIIVPTTFFELNQQPMEYHFSPILSTIMRFMKYFCLLISIFLVPLWFMTVMDDSFTSRFFVLEKKISSEQLFIEIMIVEVFLSFVRLASYNTPGILSTSMSLAATIILSEVAASIGLVSGEVVFYCALSTLSSFSISSYETSRAMSFWHILIIVFVGFFNKIGFIISTFAMFLTLVSVRNFGSAYLYPFVPFDGLNLFKSIFRLSTNSKYTTKVK